MNTLCSLVMIDVKATIAANVFMTGIAFVGKSTLFGEDSREYHDNCVMTDTVP